MASHNDQNIHDEAERFLKELDRDSHSRVHETASSLNSTSSAQNPVQTKAKSEVPWSWILLGAFAFSSMVSALAMLMFFRLPERIQANLADSAPTTDRTSVPSNPRREDEKPNHELSEEPEPEPARTPPPLSREGSDKGQNTQFQASTASSEGAWGPASVYKFGRIPDSTYPDNCAFSQTDSAGETVVSRSDVEYWACKDEGGNPTDGFSVVWADGRRTKYVFGNGGEGSIVGTDGREFPVRWHNDRRNGSKVIIIYHETGSVSWIPGHVN